MPVIEDLYLDLIAQLHKVLDNRPSEPSFVSQVWLLHLGHVLCNSVRMRQSQGETPDSVRQSPVA
eukprot:5226308-Amphidinium_carterae.1